MQGLARLAVVAAVLAVSAASKPTDAEQWAFSTGTLNDGKKNVELQLKSGATLGAVKPYVATDKKAATNEGASDGTEWAFVQVKRPLGQGDDSDSSSDRQDARGRSGSDESGGDDVAEPGGQALLKWYPYPELHQAQGDAEKNGWVSTGHLTGENTNVLEKLIKTWTKKGRRGDGSADGDSSDSQDVRDVPRVGTKDWAIGNTAKKVYDGPMT